MINTLPVVVGLGAVLSIAATVLLYIFVLPEKKRAKLPKIGVALHDVFNFKFLVLEKLIQLIYTLATVACIIIGALMIFGFSYYDGYYSSYTHWYGGEGILILIGGPIVLRLAFEAVMMFILLVKNVIQINNKLKAPEADKAEEEPAPAMDYTFAQQPIQEAVEATNEAPIE